MYVLHVSYSCSLFIMQILLCDLFFFYFFVSKVHLEHLFSSGFGTLIILLLYNRPHISQKIMRKSCFIHTCILPYTQGVVWWESLGRRWSGPDQIHSLTDQKATTDQETLQPKWEKTGGCWQIQFSEMTAGQGRNTTLCPCTEHIDKCIDKFAVVMKVIQRKSDRKIKKNLMREIDR